MENKIITEKQFKGIVYRAEKKYNSESLTIKVKDFKDVNGVNYKSIDLLDSNGPAYCKVIRIFSVTGDHYSDISLDTPIELETKKTRTAADIKKIHQEKKSKKSSQDEIKPLSKKQIVLNLFTKKGSSVDLETVLTTSGFDRKNLSVFISIMANIKRTKETDLRTFTISGGKMTWKN